MLAGCTCVLANDANPDSLITSFSQAIGQTLHCMKIYFGPSQYPTAQDNHTQAAKDNNMSVYLCYRPANNPPTTADYNAMKASMQYFQANGPTVQGVIFEQEIEDHITDPSLIAPLFTFYNPAVQSVFGFKGTIDHAGSKHSLWSSYDPGKGNVGAIGADIYATAYKGGARLTSLQQLALSYGVPLGWYEAGVSIGTETPPPQSYVTGMLQHAIDTFTTHLSQGGLLDSFMWYDEPSKNPNNNPQTYENSYFAQIWNLGNTPPPTNQAQNYGYTDYQRVVQGQSATYNQLLTGIGTTGKTTAPFYMGTASQALINVSGVSSSKYLACTVSWYADIGLTQFIASRVFVATGGFTSSIPITNRGPWMTVTVVANAANVSAQVFVISYNSSPFIDNLCDQEVVLYSNNLVNFPTGNSGFTSMHAVYGGPVNVHVDGNSAHFQVIIQYASAIALGSFNGLATLDTNNLGFLFDEQIALPWAPCQVELNNYGTTSMTGQVTIAIDR